jgi:predicted nucleic acid-binding protein
VAYSIARKHGITIYDAIFICLAIDFGIALKTFDKIQARALESEREKRQE